MQAVADDVFYSIYQYLGFGLIFAVICMIALPEVEHKGLKKKQITKKIIDYFIEVDYKKILDVIDEYYQICIEFSEYKKAITILKYTRELCELEENKDEKILLLINLSIAYSYFYAYDEKKLCYI